MTASVVQLEHLLFATLLQLAVMIGAARLLNTLFRRLGQPGVIGEIVAGLALGPSLLGSLFPGVSQALFGGGASQVISIISQIGLILLMFQIGTDFEFGHLRERRYAGAMLAIAATSISVPFGLGLLVGWRSAPLLAASIDPVTYSLFMGVGMAITAVPILGRILRQYDLTRTPIGVVAISAAALNDVVGWGCWPSSRPTPPPTCRARTSRCSWPASSPSRCCCGSWCARWSSGCWQRRRRASMALRPT